MRDTDSSGYSAQLFRVEERRRRKEKLSGNHEVPGKGSIAD